MYSDMKYLVCVALVITATVSANERKKRGDLTDLGSSLISAWHSLSSWEPTINYNVVPNLRSNYNGVLNVRDNPGNQIRNSLKPTNEYISTGNTEQFSAQNSVTPSSIQNELSNRQNLYRGIIQNGQERGNTYSGLTEYSIISPISSSNAALNRDTEKIQSIISGETRDRQIPQTIGENINFQYLGRNQIPIVRTLGGNIISTYIGAHQIPVQNTVPSGNEEQSSEIPSASTDASRTGLEGQTVEIINSEGLVKYNQNQVRPEQLLIQNIQSDTSMVPLCQHNNALNSNKLPSNNPRYISSGNFQQTGIEANSINQFSGQFNQNSVRSNLAPAAQTTRGNIEKNGFNGYSEQKVIGNEELSSQLLGTTNSEQLRINGFYPVQGGQLRGYAGGQRLSNEQSYQQRPQVNRSVPASREVEPLLNTNIRDNSETFTNTYQQQQGRNQNDFGQQRPNVYSYGELSAKILKLAPSNPSVTSNINYLNDLNLQRSEGAYQKLKN